MNKFIFLLIFGLFITSCQNTPKKAGENMATTPAPLPSAPAIASADALEQASTSISNNIKMMEDLRKLADALPSKVRNENRAKLDEYYSTLEGMIEKQTGMVNELKAAKMPSKEAASASEDAPGTGGINTAQLQDFNESAARYAKEAAAIQEGLNKMGASEKR